MILSKTIMGAGMAALPRAFVMLGLACGGALLLLMAYMTRAPRLRLLLAVGCGLGGRLALPGWACSGALLLLMAYVRPSPPRLRLFRPPAGWPSAARGLLALEGRRALLERAAAAVCSPPPQPLLCSAQAPRACTLLACNNPTMPPTRPHSTLPAADWSIEALALGTLATGEMSYPQVGGDARGGSTAAVCCRVEQLGCLCARLPPSGR